MSDNELTPTEVEADLQANLSRQTLQYRLREAYASQTKDAAELLFEGATELSVWVQERANLLTLAADRIDALEAQVATHDNYWVKPWECPLCEQSVNNSGSSVYLHLVDHEYSEQAKIEALEAEIARLSETNVERRREMLRTAFENDGYTVVDDLLEPAKEATK